MVLWHNESIIQMNVINDNIITLARIVRHNVGAISGVDSKLHYGRPGPWSEGFISLLAGEKLDTAALVDGDFRIIKQKSHEDKPVHLHTFDFTIMFFYYFVKKDSTSTFLKHFTKNVCWVLNNKIDLKLRKVFEYFYWMLNVTRKWLRKVKLAVWE